MQRVFCLAAIIFASAAAPAVDSSPFVARGQTVGDTGQTPDVVPAPEARRSPTAIAATTLADGTYAKVVYSSPRKRGRVIFGDLVPYGDVWRTGANEATEITLTGDVTLAGHPVEKGTYAIFTVPGEESWTVVLNGVLGQWGMYEYDESRDVLRFEVPAGTGPMHEAFTIEFVGEDEAVALHLAWDRVSVSVPVGIGIGG